MYADILLRDFAPRDRDAFRELNEAWIQEYFCLEEEDRLVLGDPETNILQRGGSIFIAEADGAAVGCCALLFDEPGIFELGKMAVAPAMRGHGIGRRILAYTLERARALGATRIHLGSHSRLPDAIHLYEAFGFRHLPPERFPNSPYARAEIFMELDL